MMHAVVDEYGWVQTVGTFDVVTGDMVPIPESLMTALFNRRAKVVNGDIVLTDIPLAPPAMFMTWVPSEGAWRDTRPIEQVASDVRDKRNALIAASDWTQLPDVPLTTKEAWAAYRQDLRDITDQPGYPLDVVWPTPP